MLKSLKRQKLHESITEEVLKFIEEKGYSQGDRLPTERFFCEQFQISRPSFREAMKKLESFGVIEIKPGSGMYLLAEKTILAEMANFKLKVSLEKKAILEMLDMREMMEKHAIEQIIKQENTFYLDKLGEIVDEYDRKRNKGGIPRQEDYLFHRTLYEGSENGLMLTLFDSIKEMDLLWADRVIDALDIHVFGRETEPLHRLIYEEMKAGDVRNAKKLMRKHFDIMRDDLKQLEDKLSF
ncbi:FadR/GntR family transcriptional regulator [Paenibacillus eucommiae]|uniref:GntR family transcriptional repressor for pyruvate dehydrogenase complex n=1 Tax=Paenibacillus eucommiae TaxID=1355755 RepID=A0ABS4J5J3_9BACL|nr:GntR family transcriptional regulator [Paenibacillus eucommiae]MBP1995112.1 GntR family transcriptional repressor for pyruvate dehydrogenase complex [Paenibacillus eucommiae]